jgi:hypothetical protein
VKVGVPHMMNDLDGLLARRFAVNRLGEGTVRMEEDSLGSRGLADAGFGTAEADKLNGLAVRSLAEIVHSLAGIVHSLAEIVRSLAEIVRSLAEIVRSLAEIVHSLALIVHSDRYDHRRLGRHRCSPVVLTNTHHNPP